MIKGSYCFISDGFTPDTNEYGLKFEWKMIGSNHPNASDREKIAYYISATPELSKKLLITNDVLREWIDNKDFIVRVAKCFLAGKDNPENPLFKDLEEGLIDEYIHDCVWLRTELLDNCWKMLNVKWNKIEKILKYLWNDFPFKNPLDLMKQIIDDEYTYPFINWTTAKFKERSPRRNKEMWKLLSKQCTSTLTDREHKKLEYLLKEHRNSNSWCSRFLNICGLLGDNGDIYLKTHVKIHNQICDGIAKLNFKSECDPKLKQYRTLNHSWQSGRVIMLNKKA